MVIVCSRIGGPAVTTQSFLKASCPLAEMCSADTGKWANSVINPQDVALLKEMRKMVASSRADSTFGEVPGAVGDVKAVL